MKTTSRSIDIKIRFRKFGTRLRADSYGNAFPKKHMTKDISCKIRLIDLQGIQVSRVSVCRKPRTTSPSILVSIFPDSNKSSPFPVTPVFPTENRFAVCGVCIHCANITQFITQSAPPISSRISNLLFAPGTVRGRGVDFLSFDINYLCAFVFFASTA